MLEQIWRKMTKGKRISGNLWTPSDPQDLVAESLMYAHSEHFSVENILLRNNYEFSPENLEEIYNSVKLYADSQSYDLRKGSGNRAAFIKSLEEVESEAVPLKYRNIENGHTITIELKPGKKRLMDRQIVVIKGAPKELEREVKREYQEARRHFRWFSRLLEDVNSGKIRYHF